MALNKFYAKNLVNQNQYHLKDKKAQIYIERNSVDDCGFSIHAYFPVAETPLWCYTRQLSQDQKYAAHMLGESETRLFVFNYRSDIGLYDKILYRDKWYEVTRTDTKDDYNGDLFVYTKDAQTPNSEDIQPYNPTVI